MNVELLVVPDCPHGQAAAQLLHIAMVDIGLHHTDFRTTIVADQGDAQRRGFTGSPTFLVDGTDLFADPGRPGCPAGSTATPTVSAASPNSAISAKHSNAPPTVLILPSRT